MRKPQKKLASIILTLFLVSGLTVAIIGNSAYAREAEFGSTSEETAAKSADSKSPAISARGLFPGELVGTGADVKIVDFRTYIRNFYFFAIGASILVATVMIMIGGVIWVTSAGNQTRVSTAKDFITQSIIGVVLLLGAYTILQVIRPSYVSLESPLLPELGTFVTCVSEGGKGFCQPAEIKQCSGAPLNGKAFPTSDGSGLRPCCTSPKTDDKRATKCGEGSVCESLDPAGKCLVQSGPRKPPESDPRCPPGKEVSYKLPSGRGATTLRQDKDDARPGLATACTVYCGTTPAKCGGIAQEPKEPRGRDATTWFADCICRVPGQAG